VHWHPGDVDRIEIFLGKRSMIVTAALVKGSIDTEIGSGFPPQSFDANVIDIVDVDVQRCKDGTFAEVYLTLCFGYGMDDGEVGIDAIYEIVDGGIGWR
jgi:hypothetical protein